MKRMATILKKAGIARSRDLEKMGISRTQIRRLRDKGMIEQVGRGVYRSPQAAVTEQNDLVEAARFVPAGVVCLLSALRFHKLTTQNPSEIWLAIDRKGWRPRIEHPPVRFIYLSGASFREGVEEREISGVPVRIFNAAKTVADCFKFRNKVGIDVCIEALREYRRLYPKRLDDVWRFAELNRIARVMRPYLEAVA